MIRIIPKHHSYLVCPNGYPVFNIRAQKYADFFRLRMNHDLNDETSEKKTIHLGK